MNEVNEALKSIGSNFRKIRKSKGMTLLEVSEITGLRPATIADIENGNSNWTIVTAMKIASALNCYLDINMTPVEDVI